MIPDKIYFPADGLPAYIDWDGSPIRTKQVEDSDVCYISKDTLLEWLKSELENGGPSTLVQHIINRINTL